MHGRGFCQRLAQGPVAAIAVERHQRIRMPAECLERRQLFIVRRARQMRQLEHQAQRLWGAQITQRQLLNVAQPLAVQIEQVTAGEQELAAGRGGL